MADSRKRRPSPLPRELQQTSPPRPRLLVEREVVDLTADDDDEVVLLGASVSVPSSGSPGLPPGAPAAAPPSFPEDDEETVIDGEEGESGEAMGGDAAGEAAGFCAGRVSAFSFPHVSLMAHQVEHAGQVHRSLLRYGMAFDTSDTGTGKTYVACKVAERLGCAQLVVVCPNIVEPKWSAMLAGADTSRYLVFPYSLLTRTASAHGFVRFSPHNQREVVMGAAGKIMLRDAQRAKAMAARLVPGKKLATLAHQPRTLLILDETHRLKNSATQVVCAMQEIIRHVRAAGGWVLHISATPFDQLFQLPQYLRFMGLGEGRAQRLIQLARQEEQEGCPAGAAAAAAAPAAAAAAPAAAPPTMAPRWDCRKCLREIMLSAHPFLDVSRALETLSDAGSDVGPKWKAVKLFLFRLSSICLEPILFSGLIRARLGEAPRAKQHGASAATVLGEEACAALADYIRGFAGDHHAASTEQAVLDAILWPLAIEDLGADIQTARALVTDVLPRLMSRMVMPDLGFARVDTELFLEDVDVSETVAELAYLPEYQKLNTRQPLPAPLSSPDGAHHVPEAEALDWRSPSWQLGETRPVECWARVVAEGRAAGKDVRSAEAVYLLCSAAAKRRAQRNVGGEGGDADDEETDHAPQLARIQLELLKVNSLHAVVQQRLDETPGCKVVVMFNYLEPLRAFAALMATGRATPVLQVTGAMPPKKRVEAVDQFNDSPLHRVMLCTIQVMNEGIDLHDTRGGQPRYAFIMACPNAIMTQQAKGRVHRAGIRSHAVTCVVFGGHALGGEAEEQLIMRMGTKNATLQTVAPSIRLTRAADFAALCGRIHAGGAGAAAAATARAAQPGEPRWLARRAPPMVNAQTWRRAEFVFRTWGIVRNLCALAAEADFHTACAEAGFCPTDAYDHFTRSAADLRRVQLVPSDCSTSDIMATLYAPTMARVWECAISKQLIDASPAERSRTLGALCYDAVTRAAAK
jgi:hypothetical protein